MEFVRKHILVPSCFRGRKTVDLSQVCPSLFTGETSPMHHKAQRLSEMIPHFGPHLAKMRSRSLNLSR